MASQEQLDTCYMKVAEAHAELSKAQRTKVGCCLVTENGTVLAGCNGLAPNGSNDLEYKQYMPIDAGGWLDADEIIENWPHKDENGRYTLVTKDQTIHAELSCVLRAAKEGVSIQGATLYTTLSCCLRCSEMIAAAGVKRVVYKQEYRDCSGLDNLKELGVLVEKI